METNIETGQYVAGSVSKLGTTWCRHVVTTGDSLAFADVDTTEYRDDIARDETGLQCYIGVAVEVDGEKYGTLCFSDTEPRERAFTEAEQQFVALLGDWVSHELEREKHHRELRAQNERLDEFTGFVAHDLRNPLSGAIGFTEIAKDRATSEVREYLDRVESSLNRMNDLIGECLVLAKEGADVGEREEVDLGETVRDAWETVQTGSASLQVETDASLSADRTRLQQLLENLFRNCVEHGSTDNRVASRLDDAVEHGSPGVTVTVSDIENGFAVSDDGPGLPDEVLAAIENPDDPRATAALGLGILIIHRITSGHGWTFSASNTETGARFEVTNVNRVQPVNPGTLEQ